MVAVRRAIAKKSPPKLERVYTDVILPIKPHFVDLIVSGEKNHEFRKYKLRPTVKRLWLYEVAPASRIRYVIETAEPKVPGEIKDSSGIGNDDFDNGLKVSNFGNPVLSVLEVPKSIPSQDLKAKFGVTIPQSYCFLPRKMANIVSQLKTN